MVNSRNKHTGKPPAKPGAEAVIPKPIKIGAITPFDFKGSNMTAYGGWLPVATMLEKLRFQEWIEQHVTIQRLTTSMPGFRFVLGMILALYVGFSRWHHLQFPATGTPAHRHSGGGRVAGAKYVLAVSGVAASGGRQATAGGGPADAAARLGNRPGGMKRSTLDTDTTVQTVYGRQMGARQGYHPKHRGKKS